MTFEQYANGRYYAEALIEDEEGKEISALFSSGVHPSEVTGWELSGATTANGQPVMVPRNKVVEVDVDELSITKQSDLTSEKVTVKWI